MQKKWIYKPIDKEKLELLQEQLNIHPILLKLLVQRGIYTYTEAKDFFRPQLEMLHNPYLMKDMDVAVKRIVQAIEHGEKILIYGDYDVDGTTSVALMYLFLKEIYDKIDYYIPDRYSEGYGVSIKGIDYAAENHFSLIISLDCGVTAVQAIDYAKNLGIDFVVCDHHLPDEKLPNAIAVLDPKRKDCPYPFKELSGCGVGFKLCNALAIELNMPSETYLQYLDLLTVSIASDIVSITGENRVLAYYGLEKLNKNPLGLKILIQISGIKNKDFDISDIVFYLGPKINAPGRMAHARASVEFLISQNEDESNEFAKNLAEHNTARREKDEQITLEAIEEITNIENLNSKRTIVLSDKSWSKGVVGIVASRLVEKYYKPTIIFAEKDGVLTGSARSIKGFSIYDGIAKCSKNVIQYGGHYFAAGLSIHKEKFEIFKKQFEQIAKENITEDKQYPTIEIDHELSFKDIDFKFYNIINQMALLAPDNMQPIFSTKNLKASNNSKLVGKNGNHIRLEFIDEWGFKFYGIAFGMGDRFEIHDLKKYPLDICYTIQSNEFNGKISLDLVVKDMKLAKE